MNRAVAVMRMHLVDRMTLFVLPVSILAAAFVINVLIWSVVPVDGRTTGAASSVYFFVLAAAVLAVTKGLPFALGMGASRRAFTFGTGLTGLVLALVMGTGYLILNRIEVLTDGWGMSGHFFQLPWLDGTSVPVLWLLFTIGFVGAFMLGTVLASVWVRWTSRSLLVGMPALILVLGAAVVLITWQRQWHVLGGWIADLTPLAVTGWLALLTLALAATTWGVLRRVRAG